MSDQHRLRQSGQLMPGGQPSDIRRFSRGRLDYSSSRGFLRSPAARLRVRILRSAYSSIKWTAAFSGGDPTFLDQANSQWLEIPVPDAATQISLRTSCTLDAAVFYVGIVNNCPGSFVTVARPAQQSSITLQGYTGMYIAAYTDFPRLSFQAADGRVVCVQSAYRPGITQCGTSFNVDADGTTVWDQFEISCG